MGRWSLYGLVVESEIPLPHGRPVPEGTATDVVVRRGEPLPTGHVQFVLDDEGPGADGAYVDGAAEVAGDAGADVTGTVTGPSSGAGPRGGQGAADAADGQVVARFGAGGMGYEFRRLPDGGYRLGFLGMCDFEVSAGLDDVVVRVADGGDEGVVSVLTGGALLATLLTLRGHNVQHASAVSVGDDVVAFVGFSGMGKSTMATLLCADGARLLTDDVLRVDVDGDVLRTRVGACELRLRKGGDDLAARFGDVPGRRVAGDGRDVVRALPEERDGLPLRAVLIPLPDRGTTRVSVQRLSAKQAAFSLMRYPRTPGWCDPQVVARLMRHASDVAALVPVLAVRIPWGPPFAPDLAAQVLAAVDAEVAAAAGVADRG